MASRLGGTTEHGPSRRPILGPEFTFSWALTSTCEHGVKWDRSFYSRAGVRRGQLMVRTLGLIPVLYRGFGCILTTRVVSFRVAPQVSICGRIHRA
jgi:hypothetical protein